MITFRGRGGGRGGGGGDGHLCALNRTAPDFIAARIELGREHWELTAHPPLCTCAQGLRGACVERTGGRVDEQVEGHN